VTSSEAAEVEVSELELLVDEEPQPARPAAASADALKASI